MSTVGGVRDPRVQSKYFARPRDGITYSDSGRLGPCPEFEILPPVVLAHAVAVMDGFLRKQMTPEDLFHYEDVFEDVLTPAGSRMAGAPIPSRTRPYGGCDRLSSGHLMRRRPSGSWRM